jgi:outer membrane protein OmpA-like peptidoglycan-associated protein
MKNFLAAALFLLLCLGSTSGYSQMNGPMVKGDKYFKEFAYANAIVEYEKVLLKSPDDPHALRNIAESYRLINNTVKSEYYYGKIVKLEDARPVDKFHYAQALMYNAKYAEAKNVFSEYAQTASTDERALNSISAIGRMDEFFRDSSKARITTIQINSDKADLSPVPYNDGVVFVSSREYGAKDKTHSWTGNPYLNLYYAKGSESNLRSPELFIKEMESKFNDGPVCFSKDGNEMFLTRNNSSFDNKSDKVVKLRIVHSRLQSGKWSEPVDLPFVNKQYNVAHACLQDDGQRIYFSSDMPGTLGGMDIFYADRTKDGWDKPVNLGNKINTKGNELFPFVNAEKTLYFSSDGQVGLGGLDVYESKYENNQWSDPRNIGYPVNTHKDDFGLVLDKEGFTGYISSNRDGGKGDDDFYFVELFKNIIVEGIVSDKKTGKPIEGAEVALKDREGKEISKVKTTADGHYQYELEFNKDYSLVVGKKDYSKESKLISTFNARTTHMEVNFQLNKLEYGVEGIVSDKETGLPIKGATVALLDAKNKPLKSVTTEQDGYYYFKLEPETNYRVKGSSEGYFAKSENITTKGKKEGIIKQDLPLEKLILNKPITLDNIYYDLAKWNIRKDAAKELDKLVTILKDNPTIVIELSSHTDCRASDQYNMQLSDKRAKSAAQYIVDKGGIKKERITGKGYGETVLINRCMNGVKCTEAEHQVNRRTEFKVLKL